MSAHVDEVLNLDNMLTTVCISIVDRRINIRRTGTRLFGTISNA